MENEGGGGIIGSGDPFERRFRSHLTSSGVYLSFHHEGQESHGPLLLFCQGPPISQK